jgi:fimbrial isopeptide formation D2 family protein/uncharacterized repeat protein (TIGR01451 family)
MGATGRPTFGSTRRDTVARRRSTLSLSERADVRGGATPLSAAVLGGSRGRLTASAIILVLIATLLTMTSAFIQAAPASAEQNNPFTPINGNNTFYAYAQSGETVRASFTKGPAAGASSDTYRLYDPSGALRWSCTIAPDVTTSTTCATPANLSSATAGAWKLTATGTLVGSATSHEDVSWNISVYSGGTRQPGRVWTPEHQVRQSGAPGTTAPLLTYYMLNDSGYVYQVQLTDYNGINSYIRANELGAVTTVDGECVPSYKSVPQQGADLTSCGSTFRVFFESPSAALPASAASADGVLQVKPPMLQESDVAIDDLRFIPDQPGGVVGELRYSMDERFTGEYVLEIDTNGNGVYTDPEDRKVRRTANGDGQYTYDYDGRDGLGNPVNACAAQNARVSIDKLGEIHVLQLDVEGRGGIAITRQNGSTEGRSTIYWDDTSLARQNGTSITNETPNRDGTAGVNSAVTGGVHGWAYDVQSWGNQRWIDDWTYQPVDYTSDEVAFGGLCLDVEKTSDRTTATRVGDTVTYEVTATNVGTGDYTAIDPAVFADDLSGVLDDGVYNGDVTASRPGQLVYDEPVISWGGALPAGESVTLTYSVTFTEELSETGDGHVRNVAWAPPGPPADPENPGPTPECDPPVDGVDPATGLSCAVVEFDIPRLQVEKEADRTDLPARGEEVTYTVTITNPSDAAYTDEFPATFTDDLSEVLDDATLDEADIDASGGTIDYDAPTLSWSGPLAPGESVTVMYTLTYTGEGDRVLTNQACVPESEVYDPDQACSDSVIPGSGLSQWKSATPSSDPLVAGSTVEYTLFFRNTGETAADVDAVDDLTHVTDDADVTVAASSPDGLTATRTGSRIAITGSVPVGETYSVTYTVTIKADGSRGDDIVANFLLDPEDTPPTEPVCEPTNEEEPDCTINPIAAVDYSKSVEASTSPVEEGTTLTYTVTVTNTGATTANVSKADDLTSALDDADVTSVPVVTGATTVTATPVVGGIITIGGTIGAGETATITYVVTVKAQEDRGDDRADNFLVNPGETPPEECDPDSDECTSTPMPNVTPSKSVDPASGTSVAAGDEVTYTLTFVNDGEADGPVDYTDHLEDVLDDAEITDGPTSSAGSVTATLDGETIAATGTVPAGETITVTYTATVSADGDRGNNDLGNFLVPGDEEPPIECVEGSALCTENPIGELADWKTVEASETPVAAGTELTYTLHFENRGEGTVDVDSIDFLTHVLDDADVTAEPTSDDLTVVRDGETITITGSLEPGQSATVVYTVTVKADDLRGDDTASNFLVPNDPTDPPTPPTDPVCQPTDSEEPDCTVTPIGRLDTSKAVSASSDPIEAGTKLAYTLTFDNQSDAAVEVDKVDDLTAVLDDATVTTEPVSSDAALTVVRDGNAISVSGTLAAGQTVTVVYVVTVKDENERGDDVASNFLLNRDEEPPTECVEGDPNCTVTPLPSVDSSKEVDPTSGSTVLPGDVLTYTLTLTNSGEAAGAVDRIDYLEGVLDDAEWTDGPTVSDPSVTAVLDGTELVIGGTLQPGQTVTVTYTLTVLPDAERGDDTLTNFLFDADDEPPGPDTECEDGDCTENYVPRIVDGKSGDPVSGTPIAAGQVVTYTLTFRNDGAAAGAVSKDDVLSGVLDDADLTTAPTASSDSLTVSEITDGRIHIEGSLEPGESATVTYSVTVRPFAEQGDHVLGNWLVLPGEDPGDCAADDPDCTTHPIGEIAATKSVDPKKGTNVEQGQMLRYALTFTNTGAGAATVDYTDHLGDVLDDATITSAPSSDVDSIELDLSGETLTVGGSLAAGKTATVTYSVTVMAYDRQGDHLLANFLGLSGSDPEEQCIADNPLCTSNPVTPPPPLAITGGELGMGAVALMILLVLGGVFAIETSRRRRLLLEATGTRDEGRLS